MESPVIIITSKIPESIKPYTWTLPPWAMLYMTKFSYYHIYLFLENYTLLKSQEPLKINRVKLSIRSREWRIAIFV
jgi:hypothetical protein